MISVVIPIYNAEKTLRKCLNSLLSQSNQDFELILVNDGSTDASASICLEYQKRYYSKIAYYVKENGGVSSARNLGIEKTSGKYVCFVDSDDTVEVDYLQVLYDALRDNHVDIAICELYLQDNMNGSDRIGLYSHDDIIYSILSERYGRPNSGPYCKIFKRDLIGDLRFNEQVFLGEDTLFCVEYAKKCRNGIYVKQGLYHYDSPTASNAYRTDGKMLEKYLTYIDSRLYMLNDTSMLSSQVKNLIVNSLFEAIQQSYFVARRAGDKKKMEDLCRLMKAKQHEFELNFVEQEKPVSWWMMANCPQWFDEWMYLYGKWHGFKLQYLDIKNIKR